MKILVFTDIHSNLNVLHRIKKQIIDEQIDLVLCPGDMSNMGSNLKAVLSRINMFKAPVYLIHGNHEEEDDVRKILKDLNNITFLHEKIIEFKGWWFGAYATSGLREEYPDQEEWVQQHDKEIRKAADTGKLIWMDHPPPSDTTIDDIGDDWHVGSTSLRKFIKQYQPVYCFVGHLHETFGKEDMIGNTIIINTGPKGKVFELEE